MKTILLSVLSIFVLSSTVNSQIFNDATVNYVMSVGGMEYAFVTSTQTNEIYQTSPFANGELIANQEVRLKFDNVNDTSPQVLARTLTSQLYAQLVNSGNIPPPPMDNMPVLDNSNGILFFASREQAEDYFMSFSSYMYDNDDTDSINRMKLEYFESYFPNFLSHRSDLLSIVDLDDGDYGLDEIEQAYGLTHIKNDVVKSFLNQYKMVGFGDSILCMFDRDFEVEFHRNNSTVLNKIVLDFALTDSLKLMKNLIGRSDVKVTTTWFDFSEAKGVYEEPNGTWKVEVTYGFTSPYFCDQRVKRFHVFLTEYTRPDSLSPWGQGSDWFENHQGTSQVNGFFNLSIDWGDGTSLSYNGWYSNEVPHSYPDFGVYQLTVSLDIPEIPTINGLIVNPPLIQDGVGVGDAVTAYASLPDDCISKSMDKASNVIQGDKMIRTEVWTGNYFRHAWAASSTESWTLKNNGNWKKKKASIQTNITCAFRLFNTCFFLTNDSGMKHNYNDKKVVKYVYQLQPSLDPFFWKSGEQFSYHALYPEGGGPGSEIDQNLILIDCN